ncbi:MAG TPA: glycosyltransferase [Candidatus Deferrimicrobiaceae bacterium]|jgi:glycosyltransferase involved in cell wall biosynthesis
MPTREPTKIAYILPNVESGGTERHVLALARSLPQERYALSLFTTAGGGWLHPEFSELMPVTVFGDPRHGRRFRIGPLEQLRTIARLTRIFRKTRPDIVHCYLPAANVIGPVAARLAGVPRVIVSKRALCDYKARYPLLRRVEPVGNRLADVVLVNSDAVRADVERTESGWQGKFRKVYNGVAPIAPFAPAARAAFREREGIPAEARVVLAVSNFYPYKGHAELMAAAPAVLARFPETRFVLVGRDAGTLAETRRQADASGFADRFLFPGDRADVPDFLRAADLFVHPSREEGFSNAILEAMAAGLPVAAFAVGGNPEAVEDGVTGLLAPPRDAGRLADAMVTLLADAGMRATMGEAGCRATRERFSIERMVGGMTAIYDALMEGNGTCAE